MTADVGRAILAGHILETGFSYLASRVGWVMQVNQSQVKVVAGTLTFLNLHSDANAIPTDALH